MRNPAGKSRQYVSRADVQSVLCRVVVLDRKTCFLSTPGLLRAGRGRTATLPTLAWTWRCWLAASSRVLGREIIILGTLY